MKKYQKIILSLGFGVLGVVPFLSHAQVYGSNLLVVSGNACYTTSAGTCNNAFDSNTDVTSSTLFNSGTYTPPIDLVYDNSGGVPIKINKLNFSSYYDVSGPYSKTILFQGSNTGSGAANASAFVDIATLTISNSAIDYLENIFEFANNTAYRFYRFRLIDGYENYGSPYVGQHNFLARNIAGYECLSDCVYGTEQLIYTHPIASSTIQGVDAKIFNYNFTGFSTDTNIYYTAITYNDTLNAGFFYELKDTNFVYDSGVSNGSSSVFIDHNLFIPANGTTTRYLTQTELYRHVIGSGISTLVYTSPSIEFYVINPFPTSTDSTRAKYHFVRGHQVDSQGFLINQIGQYVDLNGFVTSTPVLWDTTSTPAFDQAQDCSAYDNLPLFSSATLNGIFCKTQNFISGVFDWLIYPGESVKADLSNALDNVMSVFPFNIFTGFGLNSVQYISDQSKTFLLTPDTNYEQLVFFQNTSVFGNAGITLLTSSSLESFIGKEAKNKLFDLEKIFLNLMFLIFVVVVLYNKFKAPR
jgi:hypothetical protein